MMDSNIPRIPRRIAQAVLNSLKGGVVPRVGLPYIAVGRKLEVDALLRDVAIVGEGGASFRFIVGKYGSGKSFLLQTIRNYAMDRNFVVVDADLSPDRRLHGTGGQGLATYRELVKNLSVKSKPEGGALSLVLDRWINSVQTATTATRGIAPDAPQFAQSVEQQIFEVVRSMQTLVHGFDFANLLAAYYRAFVEGDDERKALVLKWFRGEYTSKTEAKRELGVSVIVTDEDWYDYLKLLALFFRQAGYSGLLVLIDELVNVYKIPHSVARQYNYEKLLAMYNDALQGKAEYIGIVMCGTPECVEDTHRGVFSYEALRSRLQGGKFAQLGGQDLLAPIIRLAPLSPEEMLVLTEKLAEMHAGLYGYPKRLNEHDLADFIKIEFERIGANAHITPREVIRDFVELLDILYQHPEQSIASLLHSEAFTFAKPELEDREIDPGLADFTL